MNEEAHLFHKAEGLVINGGLGQDSQQAGVGSVETLLNESHNFVCY